MLFLHLSGPSLVTPELPTSPRGIQDFTPEPYFSAEKDLSEHDPSPLFYSLQQRESGVYLNRQVEGEDGAMVLAPNTRLVKDWLEEIKALFGELATKVPPKSRLCPLPRPSKKLESIQETGGLT